MIKKKIENFILNYFSNIGLQITFIARNLNKNYPKNIDNLPIIYQKFSYNYYYNYFKDKFFYDLSFVAKIDSKNSFLFLMFINIENEEKPNFFFQENNILPVPISLNEFNNNKIWQKFLLFYKDLSKQFNSKFCVSYINYNQVIKSFHKTAIDNGYKIDHDYFISISLNKIFDEIRGNFRKSYKPLINKHISKYKCEFLNKDDYKKYNLLKKLHKKVSGKSTRKKITWDIHFNAIKEKKSFVVILKDESNILIAGAIFLYTNLECSYAVGVYDRNLNHLPLGHIIQYHAIRYMLEKNISKYYIIGPQLSHSKKADKKNKEISNFKKGFSKEYLARYLVKIN